MVKASRREVLTCRNPVQYAALISESALRDPIGPSEVMADQLRHLVTMSEGPNVSIRVLPRDIGYHPGMSVPLVFYEFDDAPPVVHFEHQSSAACDQDEDDTDSYRKVIAALNRIAMSENESTNFTAQVLAERWSD